MNAYVRKRIKLPGCENLSDVRWRREEERAAALGWPEAWTVREAEALSLIESRGTLTAREMAAALGLTPARVRGRPGNSGSFCHQLLRRLYGRGLLERTRGFAGPATYSLAPWLAHVRRERKGEVS